MSSHVIHRLIAHWGLLAVLAATGGQALFLPIPGSTVVIAVAVYAASGHGLGPVGVFAAATLGASAGGMLGFALGRWRGPAVLGRLARLARQPPARVHRLTGALDRHAVIALLAARWFTGTRNLAGIASGTSAMSFVRFSLLTVLAAAVWAGITTVEFFVFGGVFLAAPTWLQGLVVLLGLALSGVGLARLRGRDRRGRRAGGLEPTVDPGVTGPL
ncbi:DedA family protein [Conexibacter sp. DBS9H8]|uniref:DedA family protein n=1 Tax=Conexibacter sp. DBS9H8 TaxID=2937801 RepID=UPI00200E912D|nr:VTT domain-containing protein [Conexibacter sp. DBS9H8]